MTGGSPRTSSPEAGTLLFRGTELVHGCPIARGLLTRGCPGGETIADKVTGQVERALRAAEARERSRRSIEVALADGGLVRSRVEVARIGRLRLVVATVLHAPGAGAVTAELTPREAQVCRLAVEGLGNAEIARGLSLSISTVKLHLAGAIRKTGARTRTELASLFWAGRAPTRGQVRQP